MSRPTIQRLLKLIGLFQASRGYGVNELAEACGVTRRTIFRDLDLLRDSGVAVEFDHVDRRYRVPGRAILPPLKLTPDEALSAVVLCHEIGGKLPMLEPARAVGVKLENSLPMALRQRLRQVSGSLRIWPSLPRPSDKQTDIFRELLAAIAAREAVRVRYRSRSKRLEMAIIFCPYNLLLSGRNWYAVGRSNYHRTVRTFDLVRICAAERTGKRYSMPPGFSLERYLRNAWQIYPEPGRKRKIVIRFSAEVAENVGEAVWHHSQQLQINADGTLDFRVWVSGFREISSWILSYGDHAEVLFPLQLREMIVQRLKRMTERYLAVPVLIRYG